MHASVSTDRREPSLVASALQLYAVTLLTHVASLAETQAEEDGASAQASSNPKKAASSSMALLTPGSVSAASGTSASWKIQGSANVP